MVVEGLGDGAEEAIAAACTACEGGVVRAVVGAVLLGTDVRAGRRRGMAAGVEFVGASTPLVGDEVASRSHWCPAWSSSHLATHVYPAAHAHVQPTPLCSVVCRARRTVVFVVCSWPQHELSEHDSSTHTPPTLAPQPWRPSRHREYVGDEVGWVVG